MAEQIFLKPHERLEDLQFGELGIIISDELERFTTDAVILSDFCKAKPTDNVVDLGSGTGIISLLVHGRYGCDVTGIEINADLCDMSLRSVQYNNLTRHVRIFNADCTEAYKTLNGMFNVCVCNPPYFDSNTHLMSPNKYRWQARTKVDLTLGDITLASSRLLRSGGVLYMCYPVEQMADLIVELRKAALEPKQLRCVRSSAHKPPYLALVCAKKDGGKSLTILDDLVVRNNDGSYTDETARIYHIPQQ